MASSPALRDLSEVFRSTLLAWATSGTLRFILADPQHSIPDGITISEKTVAPGISAGPKRLSLGDMRWPELGLHASPYPCLLCVIEGEADIRIGFGLQRRPSKAKSKDKFYVYSLPAKSCLLIPPSTPYDDGSTPHWERAQPEAAHSRILWLRIMPVGATVHTCSTSGHSHTHTSAHFIQEAQLAILVQLLLEKAMLSTPDTALLKAYLSALLCCVQTSWNTGFTIENVHHASSVASTEAILHALHPNDAQSLVLERACRYIESHLMYDMSPSLIARHAFVSPAQLKRIFREQLDTPVMRYVAERRLEEAKVLLEQTNLTTSQIGAICGYRYRTHFSRAFKNHTGISPQAFRHAATKSTDEACVEPSHAL